MSLAASRPHQVAGIALILGSGWAMREALHLQYYSSLGPGPGFFPFWIALLLGLLGGVMLYQASVRPSLPSAGRVLPDRAGGQRITALVIALCAPILVLELLGFRLTMLAFMVAVLKILGCRGVVVPALIAVAGSFGVYHVFVQWLGVPLPLGRLGF
jgi:putative tricarboxylic transport membrane protein